MIFLRRLQNFMKYIFCAYRDWAHQLYKKLSKKYPNMVLINSPKKLTIRYVKRVNPDFIFFPDWSWIVPKEIVNNYKCVCFHESNLPKFRGGSPLQNQIIRGVRKTKSTAFLMDSGLDTGDILLQKDLSLEGSLQEIFSRMIKNDYDMCIKILQGKFRGHKQKGKSTVFKRRKPNLSELKSLSHSRKYLYDFIRMLADPYPNAFIKVGGKKIIFKSATFDGKKIRFDGEIE